MIKPVLGALGLLAGVAALPTPLAAQVSQRVLVIYGNDRCPTNKAGEEVVVCARRPESERYRIPSELRSGTATSGVANGAAVSAMAAGGTAGSSTCSNIGGGGGSTCFSHQMQQAKAQRAADKAARNNSPEPQ